jgi:hypothetical protein
VFTLLVVEAVLVRPVLMQLQDNQEKVEMV